VSLRHHPSEAVLADYAAGGLADGPSLVVSAHLERCPRCRAELRLYEGVGGVLMANLPPADMDDDALALALARIERPAPPLHASGPVRTRLEGLQLPRALARRGVGPRRFVAPGLWAAPIPTRHADGWRTYLLRAPAGATVPHHDHAGPEFVVLLRGAYVDDTVRYGEGDFAESGAGREHHPKIGAGGPCLCLVSGQGGIKASGWVRLLKPLLGV
jgi:putative transcriptional regulator